MPGVREFTQPFKDFYAREAVARMLLAGGFALNVALWVLLLYGLDRSAESVFLHYTIYFGVDRIGPWWQALLAPAAGLAILLGAAIPASRLDVDRRLHALLLVSGSFAAQALLLLGGVFTVLINN